MLVSKRLDANGDFGLPGNIGDDLFPVWSTWLTILELLAGLVFLFSPAIAAGDVAAATDISLDRAVEFVVGMLGVVLATVVRNRAHIDDESSAQTAAI
jgi:hypothetical protein